MSSIAGRLRRKRANDRTVEDLESSKIKPKTSKLPESSKSEASSSSPTTSTSINPTRITSEDFFNIPCETLSKKLLGCILCHKTEKGVVCRGRVVETEAYLGGEDKASHSYNGRRTVRNEAMYMSPGTCYVYSIYGLYCCVNVSSQGDGAAVLIRALEPLEGLEDMYGRRKSAKKDIELCNGPSKLCQAMDIRKSCDKVAMTTSEEVWLERDDYQVEDIVVRSRIGVDYAKEWAGSPLRFYVKDNKCVSKK